MIVFHKEIRLGQEWEHLTTFISSNDSLWEKMYPYGDTFIRRYSKITTMDIDFHDPICPITHWSKQSLLEISNFMGEKEFDKEFGFWPWDSIGMFAIEDDVNALVYEYGVYDVRLIGWKV